MKTQLSRLTYGLLVGLCYLSLQGPLLAQEQAFVRGDTNTDGRVDISDAIATLEYLFLGGGSDCEDAADANDDASIDISDAISTLRYLFLGGEPPAAPGPTDCGIDPTPDELGCESAPCEGSILEVRGDREVRLGNTLSLELFIEGEAPRYGVRPLPLVAGASLDSSTGRFVFRPTPGQVGDIALEFSARSGEVTASSRVVLRVLGPEPGASTALRGVILDANDAEAGILTPLVGATVRQSESGAETTSGEDGTFLLEGLEAGITHFEFDGETIVLPDDHHYGSYLSRREVFEGVTNVIDRPFYLMHIEDETATPVNPDGETIVTNERLGITLRIPAHSAMMGDEEFDGVMTISEVPRDFTPGALPEFLQPPLVVSLQPMGIRFTQPAPMTFPNPSGNGPSQHVKLWSLDHDTGRFVVTGVGRSTGPRNETIETATGGLRGSSWHFFVDDPYVIIGDPGSGYCRHRCPGAKVRTGSNTSIHTGALEVEHELPSYRSFGEPRVRRLIYWSDRVSPQPVVATSARPPVSQPLPDLIETRLEVAGLTGGAPTYSRFISDRRESQRYASVFDARGLQSGLYPYELTLGSYRGGRTQVAATAVGEVLVLDEASSPFGAGWSLEELARLENLGADRLLLIAGDGSTAVYTRGLIGPETFRLSADIEIGPNGRSVETGDFNEDGRPDLVVPLQSRGVTVLLGEGGGTFRALPSLDLESAGRHVAVGDLDGDEHEDFVVAAQAGVSVPGLYFFFGDGEGGFRSGETIRGDPFDVRLHDLDQDGTLDLIYTQSFAGNNQLAIRHGSGDGSFGEAIAFSARAVELDLGDVNLDGHIDIVTAGGSPDVNSVLLGDGFGSFLTAQTFPAGDSSYGIEIADMNADGLPDIVSGANEGGEVVVSYGDGLGNFPDRRRFPVGGIVWDVRTADVNDDGFLDVLATEQDGDRLVVLRGDGQGGLLPPVSFAAGNGPVGLTLGHFDGDGILDVAVANLVGSTLTVLRGAAVAPGYSPPVGANHGLEELPGGGLRLRRDDLSVWYFDADGRQVARENALGHRSEYRYDDAGRLVEIRDPAGLATRLTYSGERLASLVDPAGRETRFEHDGAGRLTRIVDVDATERSFSYDSDHHLVAQLSRRGHRTEYRYDDYGRHVETERSDGAVLRHGASELASAAPADGSSGGVDNPLRGTRADMLFAEVVDPLGNTSRYSTDHFGLPTEYRDPSNNRWIQVREGGQLREVRRPDGGLATFEYDSRGRLTHVEDRANGQTQRRVSEYDEVGREVAFVDPLGHRTESEYDERGRLTLRRDALGGEQIFRYDLRGLELSREDEEGAVTRREYDERGKVNAVVDALGERTEFEHDAAGNIIRVVHGAGSEAPRTREFEYDGRNRLLSRQEATGGVYSYSYDEEGNLLTETAPTGETTQRTYDSEGRVTRFEHPARGSVDYSYDLAGQLISTTDGEGHETLMSYDRAGRLVRVELPGGAVHSLGYGREGQVTSVRGPDGRQMVFLYDGFGRKTRDTSGQQIQAVYDLANRVTRRVQGGLTTTFRYDALGRLLERSSPEESTLFTYDRVGRLLSVVDADSEVTFEYDALGRVVRTATGAPEAPALATLEYEYDVEGRRTLLRDSAGAETRYERDAEGRLERLELPGFVASFERDAAGRITRRTSPGAASTRSYDEVGRLAELRHLGVGGGSALEFVYRYDASGYLARVEGSEPPRAFGYDELFRLIRAGTEAAAETYSYDLSGNRVASHRAEDGTFDSKNQILTSEGRSYTHDARGNLASSTAGEETSTYEFDSGNRLVRFVGADGSIATYAYDGLGRRIAKTVDGVTRRYVHDGRHLLLELDEAGNPQARYVHGEGLDSLLGMQRAGASYSYRTDHVGSVRSIVDAAGAVVNRYDYDAFGQLLTSDEDIPNPFGFTGRDRDAETGLYYHRARYYDPSTGRFLSTDPLGLAAGDANLYRYTGGNPVNFVDPLGTVSFEPVSCGLVLAGAGAALFAFGTALYKNGKRLDRLALEKKEAQNYQDRAMRGEFADDPELEDRILRPSRRLEREACAIGIDLAASTPGTSVTGPPVSSGADILSEAAKIGIQNAGEALDEED